MINQILMQIPQCSGRFSAIDDQMPGLELWLRFLEFFKINFDKLWAVLTNFSEKISKIF